MIPEPGFADLIKASKLIEINTKAVRHDEPVKRYGEATLAGAFNGMDIAKDATPGRNENVAMVVRIHVIADQTVHRSGKCSIEAVCEHAFDNGSFK